MMMDPTSIPKPTRIAPIAHRAGLYIGAVFLALLAACQGVKLSSEKMRQIESHMISFDKLGSPISPVTDVNGWEIGTQVMTPDHYRERIRIVMERAHEYLVAPDSCTTPVGCRKVLLFVHGGLNTPSDSRERVLRQTEAMKDAGYYPIFISWNAGLVGSYFDNLLYEHGSLSLYRCCMSPFVLTRDIIVGVLNIPPRATRYFGDRLGRGSGRRLTTAVSVAQGLESRSLTGFTEAFANEPAKEQRENWEDTRRRQIDFDGLPEFRTAGFTDYYKYSALSPSTLLLPISSTTSFLIDAMGSGSWEGMLRRTKRLFDDEDIRNIGNPTAHAGLSLLLEELSTLQMRVTKTVDPETTDQRGLTILKTGLQSLRDKLRDPRYTEEIQSLARAIFVDADRVVDYIQQQLRFREDPRTKDALPPLLRLIMRLTYPGSVSEWQALTKALAAASEVLADDTASLARRIGGRKQPVEMLSATVDALLEIIDSKIAEAQRNEPHITVFAHSMGAIIVNEMLRRSAWFPTPRFKEIVYMGAACSIRDYEDSVFPYLAVHKPYLTQFYNLMLHPRAELEESMGYDIIPRGSLLVYIDDYFSSPSTVRDRTLGRFENIMLSMDRMQPDVADQIHMKVFSVGRDQPERHGDFTPSRFWEPGFYRTKKQDAWDERSKAAQADSPPQ